MNKGMSTKTRERGDRVSDPQAKLNISALERENLKLKRKIAELKANNVSLRNDIRILKERGGEIKVVLHGHPSKKKQTEKDYG